MKKIVFYFFVIATIFACFFLRPVHDVQPLAVAQEPTKYGAFLAAQHAIYVNDFKSAADFAKVFSDVSYNTTRRTYNLSEFLNGNLPLHPETLAKTDDAASRIIYDAYLVKHGKWGEVYNRYKNNKTAVYAPLRIWSGVAKNHISDTIKYIDGLDTNSAWKSFLRGQVYAENHNITRAADEFARVDTDFMNINDYVYLMSFYTANNMGDAAETLRKEFTNSPAGLFMATYDDFPEWRDFSGPHNALAFNFIQNVSHTKVMLFSDLSVLMLRFAQIVAPENTWIQHSTDYYIGQFFSNMGGDYRAQFDNLGAENPFYLFAQMHIAEETDSVDLLKKILVVQPLFLPAINKLVSIYTGAGNKTAALRVINKALGDKNLSDSGRVYLIKRRALVYFLFDDINRAQADIHDASRVNKMDNEILALQARIWARQNREIENAYDYAMTMIRQDPTDIVAWDTLAVVVERREGNDAALNILGRVGRSAASCSSLFEHLGDAHMKNGDKERAADAYMRALELSKDGLSIAPNIHKKLRKAQ